MQAAKSNKGNQKPYRERGARLRARRKDLADKGELRHPDTRQPLTDLAKIANAAGISVSGFQQWERGETWPSGKRRARLAAVMRWTPTELDYGTQPQTGADKRGNEMHFHPLSPDEMEVVALYRGLQGDATLQEQALDYLKSQVAAHHTMHKHVGGPVHTLSDAQVGVHLTPAPAGSLTPTRLRRSK